MSATDQFMEKANEIVLAHIDDVDREPNKLAAAIERALSTAHREGFEEGMKRAAEIADSIGSSSKSMIIPATASVIRDAIRSEAERTA